MRRFSYVVSFVGCIMLGMFLGNFLGVNFAKAVTRWWLNYAKVDPLRPGAKELLLVSPQFWEFIAVICGLVGALYLACHLGAGQKRFFRLLDLKRVHRMTFFEVRQFGAISNNLFADILWAVSYSLAELVIPTSVEIWSFAYTAINWFSSLSYFSIVAAFIVAMFAYQFSREVIDAAFSPRGLSGSLITLHKF